MSRETTAWGANFSRRWIVAARPGSIAFQQSGLQHTVRFNFDIRDEGGLPCQSPGFAKREGFILQCFNRRYSDVILLRGLLILGLIGLNAFFAATEYALLSVRRTRIEQLVREGDPRARLVQVLLADIGSLISGTQLGVTVVSLLMGWLGEGIIAAGVQHLVGTGLQGHASVVVVHSIASACAFVLITVFLMVLGELVPKAVAYDHAEMVSLVVARPMLVFLRLSRYAVGALVGMANGVLGALGRSPLRGYRPLPTPEEVKLIVSSIRKHGLLRRTRGYDRHGL